MADSIGQLNRRITIRVPGYGQDDNYGGATRTYLTSDAIWAGVSFTPAGSDERASADQYSARQVTNFTIRYRDGISTEMEVVYGDLIYKIDAIQPDVGRMYLTLECLQIGAMRDNSLIDSAGAELVDGSLQVLIVVPGAVSEGYESPQLTFS